MKPLILLLFFLLIFQSKSFAQTEFELEPSQSMLMTGKGPGQDGTINPYFGQDCYAIIENFGEREFSIRIQERGKLIEIIPILKGEKKKIKLLKSHELYLDTNSNGMVKARVNYEKMNP